MDFVESTLAISQEIVQPALKRLNRFWRITFGIDPHFDFVPRCVQVEEARASERGGGSRVSFYETFNLSKHICSCNFSTYNYTPSAIGFYDLSKWDKEGGGTKKAGGDTEESSGTNAGNSTGALSSPLSYDEYAASALLWAGSNVTVSDLESWAAANATAEVAGVLASGSATSPEEEARQIQELEAYAAQIVERADAQQAGFTWMAGDFKGMSADRTRNYKQCKSYANAEMYRRTTLCYMDC